MILHTQYQDDQGHIVYLDSIDAIHAFYKIGSELVVSSVQFFTNKYSLIK